MTSQKWPISFTNWSKKNTHFTHILTVTVPGLNGQRVLDIIHDFMTRPLEFNVDGIPVKIQWISNAEHTHYYANETILSDYVVTSHVKQMMRAAIGNQKLPSVYYMITRPTEPKNKGWCEESCGTFTGDGKGNLVFMPGMF